MRKQWLSLFVVLLVSVSLWGCGSNRDSEPLPPSKDVSDAASVGNCTICHTTDVHTQVSGVVGQNPSDDGLGSAIKHDCEACHGGGEFHRGDGPIPYPDPGAERCSVCHSDQVELVLGSKHNANDSTNVEMLIDEDEHYLHGYCQRCHSAEGSVAFRDVIGERSDITSAIVDHDEPIVAPAEYEALEAEDASGDIRLHTVTCAACHDPLTKKLAQFDPTDWDPNQNNVSDQFDMCTSCHNYSLNDGTIFGSGETVTDADGGALDTAQYYHNNSWYRIIATTHFDNPATEGKVEGYVVRQNGEAPCFDCHGHEVYTNTRYAGEPDAEQTIHTQWAQSNHGGKILEQVVDAVAEIDCTDSPSLSRGKCNEQVNAAMSAYTDDTVTPAWTHYDWDSTIAWDSDDMVLEDDRGECQMCHTATGASNFMNDPENYDQTNNDFSHLAGWSLDGGVNGETVSSTQNEVLYCWGCHSNTETGQLRNPGSIPRPYTVGGDTVMIPDVGNSNVCINCHGARGNMESYELAEDPTTDMSTLNAGFGPNTQNVTEAHYLVAAATIYAADTRIGYEYTDPTTSSLLDYAPVSYFAHDGIATDELDEDGNVTSSGPCAACHMQTDGSHLFEVVEKDSNGVITGLNSTVCIGCHDGEHGAALVTEDREEGTAADAAAFLETEAEGYHEALEILRVGLSDLGINFQSGYPYFDTSAAGSWINEGNFGAAHNYNYLHHEPGAYAHNRIYAKRLLFDSIDWVEDDSLDGSITVDANTYPEAAHWFEADENGVATRP